MTVSRRLSQLLENQAQHGEVTGTLLSADSPVPAAPTVVAIAAGRPAWMLTSRNHATIAGAPVIKRCRQSIATRGSPLVMTAMEQYRHKLRKPSLMARSISLSLDAGPGPQKCRRGPVRDVDKHRSNPKRFVGVNMMVSHQEKLSDCFQRIKWRVSGYRLAR